MTDVVDRLRAAAPGTMLSMQVNDLAALREAADEIERLRAALAEAIDDLESAAGDEAGGMPMYVARDIEKLRKLLNQQSPNKEG